ncbi:MAG: YkgJ family cysteine cluster protein [Vicinamibacteria bacterium]
MRDGPARRGAKAIALVAFQMNLWGDRRLRGLRGRPAYRLGGACHTCARCCEEPSIRANAAVWYVPTLRSIFLWWQRAVNGFILARAESHGRVFVFRCTHFDRETRRCDSYDMRPGMCRDYPRALLQQSRPEFLPGCGYRAVSSSAGRFLRVLQERGLSPEQMAKLREGLYLDE